MTPYILTILFAAFVTVIFIGGGKKLKLKVKSIGSKETFTAEKKGTSRGNTFLDWFYYDSDGKSIEDENLKKMIFEAFSDEDWYGDYEFYTKAKGVVKPINEPTEEEAA